MTTIDVQLPAIWQPETQQLIYRSLLTAFSYPGCVQSLNLNTDKWDAAAASLATMVDGHVGFAIGDGLQDEEFFAFYGWPPSKGFEADWLMVDGRQEVGEIQPKLGSLEEPELSATLLIVIDGIGADAAGMADAQQLTLEGPGIQASANALA